MSISSQISRIGRNVSDALDAVAAKGVAVPSGSNSDALPGLIARITGGAGAVTVTDTPDAHGGIIRSVTAVDISDTTACAADVAPGKYFYTADGTRTAGTASAGRNVQAYDGWDYSNQTSLSATGVSLTVGAAGRYRVSWIGFRNNSQNTFGSQLYINGAAYGSEVTSFTRTYGQRVSITGVELAENDVLVVRARARSTSYYMYVGNLIIEQMA